MEAVIRLEGLTKSYGKNRGVAGLDLEVYPGEVFGYLGPNGAGKTTTIRLLLDLIRPTSGRAVVLGSEPRAGGPALRRRIGYLAGDLALYRKHDGPPVAHVPRAPAGPRTAWARRRPWRSGWSST